MSTIHQVLILFGIGAMLGSVSCLIFAAKAGIDIVPTEPHDPELLPEPPETYRYSSSKEDY